MAAEVAEQPTVLRRLLTEGADQLARARARIRQFEPRLVLLAARGTSDHAALYAKYVVEIGLGLPAGLVSPSSMTVYGTRPDLSGALFVAVSQSGSSPDLVDSTQAARECGALTVAVTNNPASDLAVAAELHLDVRAGAERAVAATKTYTAELLALRLLLVGRAEEARALPELASRTLEAGGVEQVADRIAGADRLVVTARGYSHATAREAALKLMETSYVGALAYSAADLLHGPLAVLDDRVPVLAVVSPGRGGEATREVLDRVRGTGAPVLLVAEQGDLPVVGGGLPEDLLPVLEILPLQRLALALARARGVDPDHPRGLAKVTRTR